MPAIAPAVPTATEAPRLRLLGAPALQQGTRVLPLGAERAHGLLALLACRREWVRRDELADLFYPGRDLEGARSNLRKVIHLARKVEGVGEIEQHGELLRWAPDSDLARFEAACDARRHAEAVACYGGPLLLGLDAAWPGSARDWLDAERQRLQSRWHEACARRLAELAGEPEALRTLAQTMLGHDPLDDVALQALARAQQALGRADEALAAIAAYSQRMTDELQLAPPAAVRQLADDLRSATPAAAPAAAPALVGRRHERGLVRARLADPACRLLTLLGPPGVGKSALARSIAAAQAGAWVPLEPVSDLAAVPAALAAALGLTPDGRLEPWTGLAHALGARAALVVLDCCESLPLGGPLAGLLAACPGLQVLATSRTPLGVPDEWRLPLEGLPLPDPDERDPEVLRANDAVALFEQRVLRLVPGFRLAAEAADVVRLVHAVDGLPLAIELLAAWRRVMPVHAIVDELASTLDLLEPSAPGERSVRAAFERSWRRLALAEQRVLALLAQLPGPCDRELVRQVVQAPLPLLAALVDHSLLRVDDQGGFTLHPLIRRCAAPLAGDVTALRERHARHAAATLGRGGAALDRLLPHALAAWDWAVEQADAAVLGTLAPALAQHLVQNARWQDGLPRAAAAEAALRTRVAARPGPHTAANADAARALGAVLVMRQLLRYGCGDLDDVLAAARAGHALAAGWDLPWLAQQCFTREGSVHWQRGHYDAAEAAFQQAHALARALADTDQERYTVGRLALVAKARGRYDEALAGYAGLLQALRAEGRLAANLYLCINMGNLLRLLGRDEEALSLLHEGLVLGRASGQRADEPYLLVNLGLAHETAGRLDQAAPLAEQALASARDHGEPVIEAATLLLRARVTARRTHQRAALADVHAALAIERRLHATPLRVQCLSTAGVVLAACGDAPRGVALVRWALQHPDFAPSEREDAARHLAALGLADAPFEALESGCSAGDLVARLPLA